MEQIIAQALLMVVIFGVLGFTVKIFKRIINKRLIKKRLYEKGEEYKKMISKIKKEILKRDEMISLLSGYVESEIQTKYRVLEEQLYKDTLFNDIDDSIRVLAFNLAQTAVKYNKGDALCYEISESKSNKKLCKSISKEIYEVTNFYRRHLNELGNDVNIILDSKKRFFIALPEDEFQRKQHLLNEIDEIITKETSTKKKGIYDIQGRLMNHIKKELKGRAPTSEVYNKIYSNLVPKETKHLNQEQIDFAFKALGF